VGGARLFRAGGTGLSATSPPDGIAVAGACGWSAGEAGFTGGRSAEAGVRGRAVSR
jgi:hypothetical protein